MTLSTVFRIQALVIIALFGVAYATYWFQPPMMREFWC